METFGKNDNDYLREVSRHSGSPLRSKSRNSLNKSRESLQIIRIPIRHTQNVSDHEISRLYIEKRDLGSQIDQLVCDNTVLKSRNKSLEQELAIRTKELLEYQSLGHHQRQITFEHDARLQSMSTEKE